MTGKKKKSIFLIGAILVVLLAGIVLAVLLALGIFKDKIASKENEYDPYYESFYDGENDPGVVIDGKLDEGIWQDKNWFKDTYLSQPGAKMPKWNLTTHMSEYGIYVGAYIEDENIMNDGQHTMEANTSLELYYYIANKGEKVNGETMNRGYLAIDMRGDVHGTTGKFKRAIVVDGELNSGKTKSATMEIFFPWEFFKKIDINKGIPEEIYFYPIYCAVFEGKETMTTSISSMDAVVKAQLYIYKDYWRFDKDGYKTADRENPVVGDSVTGLAKTGNWDITREKDGVVRSSNGSREHYMYFSKEYTNNFIAETTLVPVKQNNGEAKAGLYFLTGDGQYSLVTLNTPNSLLVDSVNGTKNISKYVMSTYDNKTNVYDYHDECQGPNPNATKQEGVKLTVVKNGGKFWYFVDGKFMTSEVKDFMNCDVIPAFYAWYADVEFKDYSVRKVDADETKQYLNEHGVYSVDARVKGSGGEVEASQIAVAKGQKYDITITSNSGYEVSSILVNGVERIADAKKNAKGGVYTITADNSNQEIVVSFKKCEGFKLSGFLKGGSNSIPGTLTITSNSNGILRYVVAANENKGYQVVMPAGNYTIKAEAEDYITDTVSVSLNKATTKDITLKPSMFAAKVNVDGKQVRSNTEAWDRSQEAQGKIYGSYNRGTSLQPLYFAKTGTAAWFSSTIRYSTNFVEGGSYQSDLLGGLMVSDGAHTGWFGVRQHGIVYNGSWIEHVIGYDVMSTWNKAHLTVDVDFILLDGDFHVYVDGIYATKVSVTKVAPGSAKDGKFAMGLVMHADKMADIEFSNIEFRVDETQIRKDFAALQAKHTIPDGTLFAQSVKVNNKTVESQPYRWDLAEIKKNAVTCNDGISTQPLMFAKTGKNALIQMTITRMDDKTATNRETQPLAGIYVTDGSKTGYFGVRASAIVTNDQWDHIIGRDILATWSGITTAELEVALKDNEFHIYVDGIFVKKVKVSEVLPGVSDGTNLALGLVSEASGKTASVKFSNIKHTTDAAKVAEYLDSKDPSKAIPAGTIFAGTVTVNGKKVDSVVPVWDITNIKDNIVIGNSGIPTQPLLFGQTGTTALVETTVTRLDDKTATGRESQPMAGIYVSDGTNSGFLGVRAYSVVYGTTWLEKALGYEVFVTWMSTHQTADIDFVLKNNQVQIYVDGIFVKTIKVSDIAPGIKDNTTLAMGLVMDASGKFAQLKFADVKFTTEAAKIEQYLEDAAGDNAIPQNSIFASKVTVNNQEVKSIIPVWDLTDIANNTVIGNNASAAQPLLFKATGKAALVEMTATRMDDATAQNRESQPMAGIYITDGTKKGYIGVRASAVVINDQWDHIIGRDLFATWSNIKTADIDIAVLNNKVSIYIDGLLMKTVNLSQVVPGIANDATIAVGLAMEASGKTAQMKFSNVKYTTDAEKVDAYVNPTSQFNDPMFTDKVTVNGKEALSGLENWAVDGANKKATGTHTTNSVFYMAPLYFKGTGTSMLFQATIKNISNPIKDQPLAGLYITDGTNKGGFGLFSDTIKYGQWLDKQAATLPYGVLSQWADRHSVELDVALKNGEFHIYLDGLFVTKLAVNSVMFTGTSSGDLAFGLTMRSEKGVSTSLEFSDINFTTDAAAVDAFLASPVPPTPVEDPMFADKLTVNSKEVTSNTTDWVYDGANKTATGTHTVTNVFAMAPLYFKESGTAMLLQTTITNDSATIKSEPMAGVYVTDGTNKGHFGLCGNGLVYGPWNEWVSNRHAYAVLSQWGNKTVQFDVVYKDGNFALYVDQLFFMNLPLATVLPNTEATTELAFGLTMRSANAEFPCVMKFSNINFTTDAAAIDEFLNPEDPMFADKLTVNSKEVTSNKTDWVYDGLNKTATGTHTVTNVFAMAPLYFKQTGTAMLLQTTITNESATIKSEPMAGVYVTDGTNKGHFGLCGNGLVYGPWNEWVTEKNSYAVLSQWGNKSVKFDVAYKDGNFALYVDDVFYMNLPLSKVMASATASTELAFGLTMRSANAEFPCIMKFSNIVFTTDATAVDEFIDENSYDPSIKAFIEYARALGEGYENGVGSNKITVDENTTIFIGDSFFERRYFWTDFYTDDYKDANAFCAGIGSTTTDNWTHLIDEVFAVCGDKAPKNIVIHLGTNDLWNEAATADYVIDGLKEVFDMLHTKYPQTNIYYFGITHRANNSSADKINAINSSISTYSQGQDYLTYIDTPSKITAGMLRDDGLHPKLETYDVFVRELEKSGCVVLDKNGQPLPVPVEDPMFAESLTVNGKEVTSNTTDWVLDGANKKATGTHTTNSVFYMAPLYFKETGSTMLLQTKITNISDPIKDQPLAGLYITDGTNKGGFGVYSNLIKYGQWLDKNGPSLGYAVLTQWDTNPSIQFDVALKNGELYIYVNQVFVTKLAVNSVMFSGTSSGDLAFGLTMRSEKGVSTSLEFSDINFTTDAAAVDAFLAPPAPAEDVMFATGLTVNSKEVTSNTTDWVYDGENKIATGTHTATNVFAMAPLYFKQTGTAMLLQTTITNDSETIKSEPMAGVYVTDGTNKGHFGLCGNGLVYGPWNEWVSNRHAYAVLSQWGNKTVQFDVVYKDGNFALYVDQLFFMNLPLSTVLPNTAASTELAFGLTMRSANAGFPCVMKFSNINFTTDAAAIDEFLNPEDPMFAEKLTVNSKEVASNTTDWVFDGENKTATGTHNSTSVFAMAPLYFKESGTAMLLQTTISNDSETIKSEPMAGIYVTDGTNKGHFGLCGNGLVYGPWNEWVTERHSYAVLSQWGNKSVKLDVVYKDGNFALYVDDVFYMNLPLSKVLPNAAATTELAFGLTMRSANAGYPCVMKFSNIDYTTDIAAVDAFIAGKSGMKSGSSPLQPGGGNATEW